MTKEQLIEKMDLECPGSGISYDCPAPLLYRLYRMYRQMQEYQDGRIFVDDCEDDSSGVVLTLTLTSKDQLDGPWAVVTVYKDGSWNADGCFVDLPLDRDDDINEKSEDAAMEIFVRDLPPLQ